MSLLESEVIMFDVFLIYSKILTRHVNSNTNNAFQKGIISPIHFEALKRGLQRSTCCPPLNSKKHQPNKYVIEFNVWALAFVLAVREELKLWVRTFSNHINQEQQQQLYSKSAVGGTFNKFQHLNISRPINFLNLRSIKRQQA
ncbi:unnamed protein product [Calypogeia fissa]